MGRIFNSIVLILLMYNLIACSHKKGSPVLENQDYTVPVKILDSNYLDNEMVYLSPNGFIVCTSNKHFLLYQTSELEIRYLKNNNLHAHSQFSPIYKQMGDYYKANGEKALNTKYVYVSINNSNNNPKGVVIIWKNIKEDSEPHLNFPKLTIGKNTDTVFTNLSSERIKDLFPDFAGLYIEKKNMSLQLKRFSAEVDQSLFKFLDLITGIDDIYLFDDTSKLIEKNYIDYYRDKTNNYVGE